MSRKRDPKIAEWLADSVIGRLNPERGAKISCTRSALREAQAPTTFARLIKPSTSVESHRR
jgi:hypothetical protein